MQVWCKVSDAWRRYSGEDIDMTQIGI